MILFTHKAFRSVVTIERDEELFNDARAVLGALSNVTCLLGDSGVLLAEIVNALEAPAVFWLDAHYISTRSPKTWLQTPIHQELAAILASSITGHVVLVDDARSYTGHGQWPSITKLADIMQQQYTMRLEADILRFTQRT